jgi:O-antigen/teichoic acid export membrane protein
MNRKYVPNARHTLDGTIWNFLGDGLALPMGFLVSVFLTRSLGPAGYGVYVLVTGIVLWVESSITGLFSRATVKMIGEAEDWRSVGAGILRFYLLTGMGVSLLFCLLAKPLAVLMGEPSIAGYLVLFAIDIPISSLAQAHRNMLVGTGRFRHRALGASGRWISRFILIVVLVGLGFSIPGAIVGNICASLVDLAIGRFFIRPALSPVSGFPFRRFWSYALPLFLSSICLGIYAKIDLFALKALGGTAAQAGLYGAAQNLALIPGVFVMSFSPLMLATLSRTLHVGGVREAKETARYAMRAVFVFLPVTGMLAGGAPGIVRLLFGSQYADAAPLFSILIVGAGAQAMISIAVVILISMEKPSLTFYLTAPLVLLALFGHLLMIPPMGPRGAAFVTTACSFAGALAMCLAVYRRWRVFPSLRTVTRSILIFSAAYAATLFWPSAGLLLVAQLLAVGAAIVPGFYLTGEFSSGEMAMFVSMLPGRNRD